MTNEIGWADVVVVCLFAASIFSYGMQFRTWLDRRQKKNRLYIDMPFQKEQAAQVLELFQPMANVAQVAHLAERLKRLEEAERMGGAVSAKGHRQSGGER